MQYTITHEEEVSTKRLGSGQLPLDGDSGWNWAGPLDVVVIRDWPQGRCPLDAVYRNETVCTVGGRLDPLLIAAELGRVEHVVEVRAKASGGVTHMWTVMEDEAYDDDEMLNAVFQRELEIHNNYGGELLASVEFNVLSESSARRFELGDKLY